ncbi:DUF3238 domain-containing protein [Bacillus manliponensis]|uniref:DUF3238 domain-containing protein n=1 Tax=Bacillus manliponensis TaxID=574376 RepID=UPI003511ECD0
MNEDWYYLEPNTGAMLIGWQFINENWYYLNPKSDGKQGSMLIGWNLINEKWYEFGTTGALVEKEGWNKYNGKWVYYIPIDYGLATNTTIDFNGYKYEFNQNGYWIEMIDMCGPNMNQSLKTMTKNSTNLNEFANQTEDIKISNNTNSISLEWKEMSNHYAIMITNSEGKWEETWKGQGTAYTVSDLESDTSYTFKLISFNENGEIINTNIITAKTLKTEQQKERYINRINQSNNGSNLNSLTESTYEEQSEIVYPMTNAFINSVQSGDYTKISWGNVPSDTNVYQVYKNGVEIATVVGTEYIDKNSSTSLSKSFDGEAINTYYDIKSSKKLPDSKIEQIKSEAAQREIPIPEYATPFIECENKTISLFTTPIGLTDSLTTSDIDSKSNISNKTMSSITPVTYRFRYQTFIPHKKVVNPLVEAALLLGKPHLANSIELKTFHGDERDFQWWSTKYRTYLDVKVTWNFNLNSGRWEDSYPTVTYISNTGRTIGYRSDGSSRTDQAPKTDNYITNKVVNKTSVSFYMHTHSANPLVAGSPKIDALTYVKVNRNGSGVVAGTHDNAPNHEFVKVLENDSHIHQILHQSTLATFYHLFPVYPDVEFSGTFHRWAVN